MCNKERNKQEKTETDKSRRRHDGAETHVDATLLLTPEEPCKMKQERAEYEKAEEGWGEAINMTDRHTRECLSLHLFV